MTRRFVLHRPRTGALRRALGLVYAMTALLVSADVLAQWYKVEIIVFARENPEFNAEVWPDPPGEPSLDGAVELFGGLYLPENGSAQHAFRELGPGHFRMKSAYARLQRSGDFRPVMHVAWQQPGYRKSRARPVHVTSRTSSANASGLPTIDGTIKIWRKRFLHVETDLLYRWAASVAGQANPAFRMTQRRRMRSQEVHFFDHPMFGMLMRISPTAARARKPEAPGIPTGTAPSAGTDNAPRQQPGAPTRPQ